MYEESSLILEDKKGHQEKIDLSKNETGTGKMFLKSYWFINYYI